MSMALPIILGLIDGAFKLLANHLGKPEGWVPTAQDIADLNAEVDEATPEHERALARERLGIPIPPPPTDL
jgi:hypothetical protein